MHICTPFSRVHVLPELEGKRVEIQVRTERQNRWAQIVERPADTSVRPFDSLRLANWVGVGCLGQAVGLSIGGEVSAERGGAELVLLSDRGLELVQRVGRHRREARQLACAARARATRRRRSLPRDAFLALLVQPSTTSHSIRHLSRCDGCKILVDLLLVYKVSLAQTNPMPAEIRAELRLRLYEVATTLADMPADHGVWESMEDSEVQIDVRGWQFFYRVDPTARRITVLRGGPSST